MQTLKKHLIAVVLLLLFVLAIAAGCGRQSLPAERLTIEQWMQEDPDSCMWYYTDQYVPLFRAGRYDSLEQIYGRILRAMPDPVPGNPDSLAYIAGWVVTFYYNALMMQDKVAGSARLTDSLAASANPFYARTLQPELLATTAKFYLGENRIDRVDSLGRIFAQLAPTSNPLRDIRAWHDMAWAIESCDLSCDRAITLQQHAVDLFRAGKRGNGDWEVLSQMGHLYYKNGDYERATELIQEAVDWMTANPGTPGDGLMNAYNDLSRLYATLGLYDKALDVNRCAIAESQRTDGWMLDVVYRMRAHCFGEAGQADSALWWTAEAEKVVPADADSFYLPPLQVERLGYFLACYPDSAGYCLEECRRLLADTAALDPDERLDVVALYGLSLLQTAGREGEGIACLERSFRDYRSARRPAEAVRLGEQLVRVYLRRGPEGRLAGFYPAYAAVRDSLWKERSLRAAIGANIRYETGRKEQENRALAAEVALKERTLVYNRVVAGVVIGLLVVGVVASVVYNRLSRRYYRLVGRLRLSRIRELLDTQKALQEHNAQLADDLSAAQHRQQPTEADSLHMAAEQPLSAEQQQQIARRLREKERSIRLKLAEGVLKTEEYAEFRRSFTAVYPHFLSDLNRVCADLTRTDELIAILLRLGMANNDIALTLGITKAGVNKARTRMRRRLGLADTGVVLEDFLKGIGEEDNRQSS